MIRSGSWPNLQSVPKPYQSPLCTVKKSPSVSALPLSSIDSAIIAPFEFIAERHVINDSIDDDDNKKKVSINSFELAVIMHAPSHHVGLCMLDSQGVSLENVVHKKVDELSDKDKSFASCIATPCEAADEGGIMENFRKNMYVISNQNRAGEIISRLRKGKRRRVSKLI